MPDGWVGHRWNLWVRWPFLCYHHENLRGPPPNAIHLLWEIRPYLLALVTTILAFFGAGIRGAKPLHSHDIYALRVQRPWNKYSLLEKTIILVGIISSTIPGDFFLMVGLTSRVCLKKTLPPWKINVERKTWRFGSVPIMPFSSWWFQPILKNISQLGSFPQIGMNIKTYMGVSKNRDTPKWMVYNGKPY